MRWPIALITIVMALVACGPGTPEPEIAASTSGAIARPLPSEAAKDGREWVEPRFISIGEAIERLQPHVDVSVVVPHTRSVYLPPIGRWKADPRYLGWGTAHGVRYGKMKLIHKDHMLILSFGIVTFDGCGGTDFHIPTKVNDHPALVYISPKESWSEIVWPMRPRDAAATFGLSGSVEGWQVRELAESMDLSGSRADAVTGC